MKPYIPPVETMSNYDVVSGLLNDNPNLTAEELSRSIEEWWDRRIPVRVAAAYLTLWRAKKEG